MAHILVCRSGQDPALIQGFLGQEYSNPKKGGGFNPSEKYDSQLGL